MKLKELMKRKIYKSRYNSESFVASLIRGGKNR